MEIKAQLNKPYTEEQRTNFIVENNHRLGYKIRETKETLDALGYTQEELDDQEYERIQELSITKSDFFDATIKAFGLDGNDLLPVISNIIDQAPVDEIMKKIALNNYQNAKDFYRKHEIFNAIVNVPLVISEQLTITLTAEQLDKFFDKASKKDPDAYKELLPQVSDEVPTQGGEE